MRIGVPREIKSDEHRVALTPAAAATLVRAGHEVLIETGAGIGAGLGDAEFESAGARIVPSTEALFDEAELIVKVKEPQLEELALLRPEHVLFGYLHLAADPELARGLLKARVTAIAYETVTSPNGGLPLLAPMSRIAGRMAVQAGAHHLERTAGGMGVLLGGVPGVPPARVTVIGAGVAGTGAIESAIGHGADVVALDTDVAKLERLAARFESRIRTEYSTPDAIARNLAESALAVGTVLVPGRSAPKLVSREMIAAMPRGAVVADVAIDQGGCFATSRPTTHADPVYEVDGVLHYCVTNIPAAVPRTATFALVNATLPYVRALADNGWKKAMKLDPHLAAGLNVADGRVRNEAVAADLESYSP
ncbi:MAG TPA: alanine dehydrogenase [Gammaproteobacteria bacterium]